MRKHTGLLMAATVMLTTAAFAQDIYPFKPIAAEEITRKAQYLSEDPHALTNMWEIEKRGLRKAKTTNTPWSGPFWTFKQGMIANPYMDRTPFSYLHFIPNIDAIKPYEKRRDYVRTNFANMSEDELSRLAPSEKYDVLLGNDLDLSNRIWDFINKWKNDMKWDFMTSIDLPENGDYEIEKKNYIVANWEGICHGWAPAAGVVPKPEKTVTVGLPDGRKMNFYPEDIKGLVSLTWANSLVQDNVLSEGLRCKRRFPKSDNFGRYFDSVKENGELLPRCADVHPAIMHLTLVNVTGVQGRSFIIDKDAKITVANQPVVSYEFKYFSPMTARDGSLNESLVDYDKYRDYDQLRASRHPSTKFLIGVESTIKYADWTMIKKPGSNNYSEDKIEKLVSLYDLELDARGNIVGGQWRGLKDLSGLDSYGFESTQDKPNMIQTRPDFLWVVPKNHKDYFRPVSGLEPWDIRSGKAAPESWKAASISAHSFEYEMSKHFGNPEKCKVKNAQTGEVKEVPCEFKYPRPQPLLQIVDQLVELSRRK